MRPTTPVLLLMTGGLVCGCTSYAGIGKGPTAAPTNQGSLAAYGSDQLEQALLTSLPGYQQSGAPQSGNYSELPDVQSFESMQQGVKLSKPQCADATGAVAQDKQLPAAVVSFASGTTSTVTETLLSMSPQEAAAQVAVRVPKGCRSFQVQVQRQWADERVTQSSGDAIGEGSRTVGVTTTLAGATTDSWFVSFYSRAYLATISLYGADATRGEATSIAQQAYAEAERVLP